MSEKVDIDAFGAESIEQLAELSYKEKFEAMLKKEGKALSQMSDGEKKEFFAKVDKSHDALEENNAFRDAK